MSIEKWLIDEKDIKRTNLDKTFENLPKEKVQDLKKRKIKELTKDKSKDDNIITESDDFFSYFLEFRKWLKERTYLKGDLDKIEIWIRNLYKKIDSENSQAEIASNRRELIEHYRKIPPKFLDEKTRIAINKKMYGKQRTNSDKYYLRKLKLILEKNLMEAMHYQVIKKILDY